MNRKPVTFWSNEQENKMAELRESGGVERLQWI